MMRQAPILGEGQPWQMVLLAPSAAAVPETMENHASDSFLHERFLSGLQRLRGRIYLKDGAIERRQLAPDGRHEQPADYQSWHLLATDSLGTVCGCARYLPHPNTAEFAQLGVSRSALAHSEQWGAKLRAAVDAEMAVARERNISFVEVGGWALVEELRLTTAALKIALVTYSLAKLLGGCIGIGTATHRHASSSILKRIGGRPLELDGTEFPSYFDPQYKCQMEILRFDSRCPNPKYTGLIDELTASLLGLPTISRTGVLEPLRRVLDETRTYAPAGISLHTRRQPTAR